MDDQFLKDRRLLSQTFLSLCDHSYLQQVAEKTFTELNATYETLGEGTHFRTWKIPLPRPLSLEKASVPWKHLRENRSPVPIESFVIKKPLPTFLQRKKGFLNQWHRHLSLIKQASTQTLLSPFMKLDAAPLNPLVESKRSRAQAWPWDGDTFSLFMPFGTINSPLSKEPSKRSAPDGAPSIQSKNLDQLLLETECWLLKRGLKLNDVPQIRWCGKHPMLIDISDIENAPIENEISSFRT